MKCHLVYAVPVTNLISRLERKLRYTLQRMGLPLGLLSNRQPTKANLESWPIRIPYENTRNLYSAISKKVPTILYHLTEQVHCRFDPDDIFLGHPVFPYRAGSCGVVELTIKESIRPNKFGLITPLHCDTLIETTHINKQFLDHVNGLLPYADILFAKMGQYWWDQWDYSPYAHWMSKMVRLDGAVDAQLYPRVKNQFNRSGQRGYLYIGNSHDPRKGVGFLSQLMEQLENYPRGWIGNGPEIPNIPRISTARSLTPEFMAGIAEQYDFFISPSRADPNPTTILESMAWGFPVVCTPQSGYYETEYRHNIYLDDVERSVDVLKQLQDMSEAELVNMADKARIVVEHDYTWEKFTSTVIHHLGL